jgi:hypothetical protein
MRNKVLLAFIILCSISDIYGQTGAEAEENTGELSLRIKSVAFFKDNEYVNKIGTGKFQMISALPLFADKSQWIEGYTLTGYFLQPELVYSPTQKVTLKAGAHMLRYSGRDKLSRFRPTFSASVNLTSKTSLTVGTLNGSDSHKLADPHFNYEKLYNRYTEDGFQLIHKDEHFFSDTWINWENYIFRGDSVREIFTFGESFRYTSAPIFDFIQIEAPLQLQFKHFGGQISDFPGQVETYLNVAGGLRVNFDIARKKYGVVGLEYLQFMNSVPKLIPAATISKGHASWLRFHYEYKSLKINTSYWRGHNFYSPNGNEIYASILDISSKYVVPDRKIITGAVSVSVLPESFLELFLGFEAYYDVCMKQTDSAITLHLNFDNLIRLATLKR